MSLPSVKYSSVVRTEVSLLGMDSRRVTLRHGMLNLPHCCSHLLGHWQRAQHTLTHGTPRHLPKFPLHTNGLISSYVTGITGMLGIYYDTRGRNPQKQSGLFWHKPYSMTRRFAAEDPAIFNLSLLFFFFRLSERWNEVEDACCKFIQGNTGLSVIRISISERGVERDTNYTGFDLF